ncbi:putative tricarboxylic transport membrane protein [Virgibacillus natechei]|uniref:Tricarboxylic transport membrane protein n=1 Tax=Virgibacillus natechei TaxID=1216297 RepID=A0ABS4IIF0_9BACI|nr:tripartite tricarboxylate transporter substrate-binding protein [Virgibacillus natechei]MBP1970732.1 putative tricarboxylic transport membrane protein [Virgibacillus natechei]UZD12029.1 tripartite tricarboxylate transporter substrate-binding protein [Virgibacillus natechei]
MKRYLSLLVLTVLIVFVAACSADEEEAGGSAEEDWAPEEAIEIVAPAGAGGGWDTTARMTAQVFGEEGIIDQDIGVINREGGGGAVGWAYVAEQDTSPHHMFVGSPPLLLVPLNGQSEYNYEDFTPIANMIADYAAFAVSADAEWDNLNELFDDMKEDPSSVTVVGTSSPGSMDHIQFAQVAKAAGVDVTEINYVSDQGGGALTQVLNGSVDVFSTGVAETIEQVKAGEIKVLGVTSEERLEGEVIEDFPTAIEQGIDTTFINWRGFFGPANMDESAVSYYEEKFKELSESDGFAEIRDQYGWDEMYMNSEEYSTYLEEQNAELESLLEELGLGE